MNKELASIREITTITTKSGKTGYICKFESTTQIGTFYSSTLLAIGTNVMVQKNGQYFDYSSLVTDAEAIAIKAASEKVKAMWS
jgi:hypothetical protein